MGITYFETKTEGEVYSYKLGVNGVTEITMVGEDEVEIQMENETLGEITVHFALYKLSYYVLG